MVVPDRAFSGRVIFDHLQKTAGQAINGWLVEALGAGCVTPNLIGGHRELIRRYGGLYSVISAHVKFHDCEGLDPRYQYMTLLRDPVDRAVSWIFYVLNDAGVSRDTVPFKDGANQFLISDGYDGSVEFLESIANPYTEHFCRVNGSGLENDEEKIANALSAIQQYDVVGVYEDMTEFIADAAALIGIHTPEEVARVNVTSQRLKVDEISPALRERILALNQLDLRLYAEVVAWKASVAKNGPSKFLPPTASQWKKYEPVLDRVVTTPDITICSATLQQGYDIRRGQLMTFDVDFSLSREVCELEMGIHVFDSNRQWAFGTNSTLLGQTHQSLSSGRYRVSHHLVADLPAGTYTAGFAFTERLPEGQQELAWRDAMCEFQIYHQVSRPFAGYSYLPTAISLRPIGLAADVGIDGLAEGHRFLGSDDRLCTQVGVRTEHDIVCTGQAGYLTFGPYIPLAAGHYRLVIHGALGEGGVAGAHVDVVIDKGDQVLTECALVEPDEEGCFLILPISLNAPCVDLEVRVWVTDNTDLRISMIEIEPLQPDEVRRL